MNYKTIIETPELIKRDILFLEYLDNEIKKAKRDYDCYNYECNNGNYEEFRIPRAKSYERLLGVKLIKYEFYKITDNLNEE